MRLTGSRAVIRWATASSRARASPRSRSGSWARRSPSGSTSKRRRTSASRSWRLTRSSARRMACSWTARVARWSSASLAAEVVAGTRRPPPRAPASLSAVDPGDGLDLVALGPDRLGAGVEPAALRRALLQAAPERLEPLLARPDPLLRLALVGLVPHEVGLDRVDAPRQGRQLHLGVQERLRAPRLVVGVDLDPTEELRDLGRHARRASPRPRRAPGAGPAPRPRRRRRPREAGRPPRGAPPPRARPARPRGRPARGPSTPSAARPRRPPARWRARAGCRRARRPAPPPGARAPGSPRARPPSRRISAPRSRIARFRARSEASPPPAARPPPRAPGGLSSSPPTVTKLVP